jgi:mxaD protein
MNRRIVFTMFAALLALPALGVAQDKELSTTQTIHIKASPEEVWALAGDFGGVARWLSTIESSRLVLKSKSEEGAIRELLRMNGTRVQEKLLEYDPGRMTLTYTYADGKVIAKDYFATMTLKGTNDGETDVVWVGRFKLLDNPPEGQDEAALIALYAGIYQKGLAMLKTKAEAGE